MRRLAGAVSIVATGSNGNRRGLTATSICSLSAEPARMLACVNLSGSTFRTIAETRSMSLNVLTVEQEELARRFAGMLGDKEGDLFRYGQWTTLATGAPVLKDALVAFDCAVDEMLVAHTHAILIGEVREVWLGRQGKPLLYANRAFLTTGTPAMLIRPDWMDYPWL